MHIRLRTLTDDAVLVGLWHQVFADTWPLNPKLVQRALIDGDGVQPRAVLLAEEQGQPLGFAVVEYEPSARDGAWSGCLVALGVVPQARRCGVGRQLHAAALDLLRAQGVRKLQLGGGSPRLWPGVPYSLPGALTFFEAQGWEVVEDSVDMLQHLGTMRHASASEGYEEPDIMGRVVAGPPSLRYTIDAVAARTMGSPPGARKRPRSRSATRVARLHGAGADLR